MYIKRDQSWRLSSSGSTQEPPVMQRRSSLRPHSKVPNAIKNEAHPMIKTPDAANAAAGAAASNHGANNTSTEASVNLTLKAVSQIRNDSNGK